MAVITLDDVEAAARRLDGVARRTPVIDAEVAVVKAESFQHTGSFKFRGAYNRIAQLSAAQRERGVCAVSSGNHAQAVALAAAMVGTTATILMPSDAPANKIEGARALQAEVVLFDRYGEDRDALVDQLGADTGRVVVPPFNDTRVMAGQGTVALELLDQVPAVGVLVVPVGGGGLIAGCAVAAKSMRRDIRVIGVEPAAGDDTKQSLAAGERVTIPVPRTIADGQQIATPGELTFPIVQELVDDVVVVSDDEIVAAMRYLFERGKVVAEPSGACAFAAVLSGAFKPGEGALVAAVLSGGNVSADRFASLVSPPAG
jgi:threo-3-hydroxy-L-aspartate ammonia-lyase